MRRTAAALAVLALTTAGCSQGGDEVTVDIDEPSSSAASPSPSGSGSASATPTQTPTSTPPSDGEPEVVETVATGLVAPWGLAFLPDGNAVVTERDTAKVLLVGGDAPHEVTELGTIGEAAPQGEGGLLGVAVSPTFDRDRLLYFYVSTDRDNRIVTARYDKGGISRTNPILTGEPVVGAHDGRRIACGPGGYLYASTGETDEPVLAREPHTLGGKSPRATKRGKPVPLNPNADEIYSLGHRNVQGLAWTDDGRLWASEFGQNTFDELNRIESGGNYGWPAFEGEGGTADGFIDPQAVWGTDVASPSGLAFADGALWRAARRGNRLWRPQLDSEGDAAQPHAHFFAD